MSIAILLTELEQKGIELAVEDGELRCKSPKGAMTEDLRMRIQSGKAGIIERFNELAVVASETSAPVVGKPACFKEYKYPDGRVRKISMEEFYQMVDAVRTLIDMNRGA